MTMRFVTAFALLLAGTSAMAFLRTSVFTARVADQDIAVGPNLLLQVMLSACDRAVDRSMAKPRAKGASALAADLDFDKAAESLPVYCFTLMQNVSTDEQSTIATEVAALHSSNLSNRVKSLVLVLLLTNVCGSTLLEAAIESLGDEIR